MKTSEKKKHMGGDQILDALLDLSNAWRATEIETDEVVWGECAYDLDKLVEKAANEKESWRKEKGEEEALNTRNSS